jgi:hypothetical protein
MATNLSQKNPQLFECVECHYSTSIPKDFKKHTETKKHIRNTSQHLATEKSQIMPKFVCENCNKPYKDRTGLWRHKKKCMEDYSDDEPIKTDSFNKDILMEIIKNNTDVQKMMMKVLENGTNNHNHSHNTTNSHNKAFNLNLYLNETCKDAMNITDFVNSIKINLDDLENTGRKGYIEGISNIFLKNLNDLEDHMRPLHCSDFKREILYVKDNNEWTKETDNKPILTKAIKTVAGENIKQIKLWKDKYPDCTSSDSRKNDLYLKIVSNSMNGLTEEEGKKNISKIISNVAKEVVIDKS